MITPYQGDAPCLSVILPAYNEAARIRPYLTAIVAYLGRRGISYEIVVVDDGSSDTTAEVVQHTHMTAPAVRLLRLAQNMGKGCAVRAGIEDARGEFLLVADADGATPIGEIERLETAMDKGADLAIGSRFLASRDRRYIVKARWHRSVLGNLFNGIVRCLGIREITDTQCGFKLFRRAVAQELFSISRINGYGFDLEILYLAQRRGYRISEVPVNWTDQPGTKVRVFQDGLSMLREMLTVRRNDTRGLYPARSNSSTTQGAS
jgi:dolichyl-phosphate beta-glucosyltransferase